MTSYAPLSLTVLALSLVGASPPISATVTEASHSGSLSAVATEVGDSGSLPAPAMDAATDSFKTDQLQTRKSRDFDKLAVNPAFRAGDYRQVHVMQASVEFRKYWQRDQNRYDRGKVRDSDVERIQEDLGTLARDELATSFRDAGFELVDEPLPGVLLVQAAIVELDVIAPDTPTSTRSFTYSNSAGAMTLELALVDGDTAQARLLLSDRKRDPQREFLEWRTRPYNASIARRMLRGWTKDLQEVLEEAAWLAATP